MQNPKTKNGNPAATWTYDGSRQPGFFSRQKRWEEPSCIHDGHIGVFQQRMDAPASHWVIPQPTLPLITKIINFFDTGNGPL